MGKNINIQQYDEEEIKFFQEIARLTNTKIECALYSPLKSCIKSGNKIPECSGNRLLCEIDRPKKTTFKSKKG